MKVRVINKKESVIYKGEVYRFDEEFEMDEVIAKGLSERGYIQAVENTDEEEITATETQDGENDPLEGKSYKELQKMAKEMGLDASGKKEELIERISEVMFEVPFSDLPEDDEFPNTNMPE